MLGAGTMGAGIAQLAALAGFETLLHDPVREALERGMSRVRELLGKGAAARLSEAPTLGALADCELLIEAAPEQLELKQALFAQLSELCDDSAILATNTSSLSVSAIAADVAGPERICGLHFFNPPASMRLVEVVASGRTSEGTVVAATAAVTAMGRESVRCSDSIGFIVNRCNRPFVHEALRILDGGSATAKEIDLAVRDLGGFPMGPFEFMDLVGIDISLGVARSFYDRRPEARWRPHPLQERMVAEGRLGRKAGRGFYDYERPPDEPDSDPAPEFASAIVERIVCQLVNEAHFALEEGVAEAADIDQAMRLGLNHPLGPFEWADRVGRARVIEVLEKLADRDDPDVYQPSALLRSS